MSEPVALPSGAAGTAGRDQLCPAALPLRRTAVFSSRAGKSQVGKLIAIKVGYAATCLLAVVALVASGYAHTVDGQDTNTLILVHIFPGGQKAAGFSISRDDLVTFPHATYLGITREKIDQAYDFAYNQSLGQTYGSSMSQNARYLKANQAGQALRSPRWKRSR